MYHNFTKVLKKTFSISDQIQNFCSFRHKNVTPSFIEELKCFIGSNKVSTTFALRRQSGTDEGHHMNSPSDVVVFPETLENIVAVAKLCFSSSIPIIPRGTGTGLELGVGAMEGGVCVDVSKMTNFIQVNDQDFDCVVEPGVTRKALNSYLRHTGLMFPVDPGADASIGGMVSTSASGTNAIRYGTMKENVLNLEVVLANGDVLHTAGPNRRSRKSAAGYNLTELFVGSEGTLGIISKVTLRLHAVPEMVVAAVCSFPTVKSAVDSVVQVLQSSIPVARIELLDEFAMSFINKYNNLSYPIAPSLFFEFHGNESSVKNLTDQTGEIIGSNGGGSFKWAVDQDERNKLWEARHTCYYATCAQKPGKKCIITDVCVPISKLTEMVTETQRDIVNSKLLASIIGHVGDGNFHALILYDPLNEEEVNKASALERNIVLRALSLDGTCTGEHGIGVGKMSYLVDEYGSVGIDVMNNIKRALDPNNIMNPGKII